MLTYFAHSNEVHESTSSSLGHLLGAWFIAIPLITLIFGALLLGVLTMLGQQARDENDTNDKKE